mmetsp:Transcript_105434/g.263926  ORF Transcript_105434/g.263926 Transcript_105434/m.263926 type:complete len:240 (+) Transcript_105434:675-1394(+)
MEAGAILVENEASRPRQHQLVAGVGLIHDGVLHEHHSQRIHLSEVCEHRIDRDLHSIRDVEARDEIPHINGLRQGADDVDPPPILLGCELWVGPHDADGERCVGRLGVLRVDGKLNDIWLRDEASCRTREPVQRPEKDATHLETFRACDDELGATRDVLLAHDAKLKRMQRAPLGGVLKLEVHDFDLLEIVAGQTSFQVEDYVFHNRFQSPNVFLDGWHAVQGWIRDAELKGVVQAIVH